MRRVAVVALLTVMMALQAVSASFQSAAQGDARKPFVGGWRLVSIIENGKTTPDRGPKPIGLTYYDATGHMALQIMPDVPRPKWSGSPTPEQAKAAIAGYGAYFGTYTVDPGAKTITHHQEGALIPGAVGNDAMRKYDFPTPDRLIITLGARHLTWERLK